ncbi:MAG: NADH-quinone oxidoreductase subunit C [Armatimonadetes bacterium]|nr:NADH-quinone oxidoreductase subunit C [Armatimonadota bacterium]
MTEPQRAIADAARPILGADLLRAATDAGGALVLEVKAERVVELLQMLRTAIEPPVSYLADLHGFDDGQNLAVIYHLFRPGEAFEVRVKAVTSRQRPTVPSVMDLWKGAWWPEREVMEMYGIEIVGHPDPRKLLLPEDWQGYPLRKDYVYPLDHPYLRPDPIHENPFAGAEQDTSDTSR